MSARIYDLPMPNSPAELIERAERMDRVWRARGYVGYPSLERELSWWTRREHEEQAQ